MCPSRDHKQHNSTTAVTVHSDYGSIFRRFDIPNPNPNTNPTNPTNPKVGNLGNNEPSEYQAVTSTASSYNSYSYT